MFLSTENKVIEMVIDRQFEMIGEDLRCKTLPEDGLIEVGDKKKKMVYWYEYYFFKSKEQYEEWREWATKELARINLGHKIDLVDLTYGLNYKIEKGQLEIF
jgi:hypothetical protein